MIKLATTILAFAIAGVIAAFALAAPATPSPSQQCRTERADANFAASHGGKTFAQFYGKNKGNANAFGKCVSAKAKAQHPTTTGQTETQSASSLGADAACAAERADANFAAGHGGKSFAQFYGTNAGLNNAFGQCVSTKAKTKS